MPEVNPYEGWCVISDDGPHIETFTHNRKLAENAAELARRYPGLQAAKTLRVAKVRLYPEEISND